MIEKDANLAAFDRLLGGEIADATCFRLGIVTISDSNRDPEMIRLSLLAMLTSALLLPLQVQAQETLVSTPDEVRAALAQAGPGDIIRVAPGVYEFFSPIELDSAGTPSEPIQLIASGNLGDVEFRINNNLGVSIEGQDYVIDGIWVRCQGGQCTGARGYSLWGSARRITIRGGRTTDFMQHIKGWIADGTLDAPQDITIASNEAYNTAGFGGRSNVYNLDGGTRWRVVGNFVHDYGNSGINYGIFLKGATTQSVIERNLVAGSFDRAAGNGAVVGISFGGGRMGVQWCAAGNQGAGGCTCEDYDGIARNNIVMNTSDVALHVNSACGSKFLNNTVYNSATMLQIQSLEGVGDIEMRNNVLNGPLPSLNNLVTSGNLPNADFTNLYNDASALDFSAGPGAGALSANAPVTGVVTDYCGAARSNTPSRGAIEMPSTCNVAARIPFGGVIDSQAKTPNPPMNLVAE